MVDVFVDIYVIDVSWSNSNTKSKAQCALLMRSLNRNVHCTVLDCIALYCIALYCIDVDVDVYAYAYAYVYAYAFVYVYC
eukprot:m.94593 g.94593  ORF g.94593 m.94593 type:complete len:80 (+) comp14730_c4_seq2:148-387(+)